MDLYEPPPSDLVGTAQRPFAVLGQKPSSEQQKITSEGGDGVKEDEFSVANPSAGKQSCRDRQMHAMEKRNLVSVVERVMRPLQAQILAGLWIKRSLRRLTVSVQISMRWSSLDAQDTAAWPPLD